MTLAVVYLANVAATSNRFRISPVLDTLTAVKHVDMVTAGRFKLAFSLAGLAQAMPAAGLLSRLGVETGHNVGEDRGRRTHKVDGTQISVSFETAANDGGGFPSPHSP